MTISGLEVKRQHRPLPRKALRLLKSLADRALPALKVGRLQVVLPNGATIEWLGTQDGPAASISLRRWRALWRLVIEGEDGVDNGYIDGDWSTPDLLQLFNLIMHNETAATQRNKTWLLSRTTNRVSICCGPTRAAAAAATLRRITTSAMTFLVPGSIRG